MTPALASSLRHKLEDVHDALLPFEDVEDGPHGEWRPNWAMSLIQEIKELLDQADAEDRAEGLKATLKDVLEVRR